MNPRATALFSAALAAASAIAGPAPIAPPLRGDGLADSAPHVVKPGAAAPMRAPHVPTVKPSASRKELDAACARTVERARRAVQFAKDLEYVSDASLTQGGDLRRQMASAGVAAAQADWVMNELGSAAPKMRDAGREVSREIESDPEAKRLLSPSQGGAGK